MHKLAFDPFWGAKVRPDKDTATLITATTEALGQNLARAKDNIIRLTVMDYLETDTIIPEDLIPRMKRSINPEKGIETYYIDNTPLILFEIMPEYTTKEVGYEYRHCANLKYKVLFEK